MKFLNLYDFAQIWYRHSLIHFLSENAKKIGGHHVGFQDGVDQSPLDHTHFRSIFCSFLIIFEGNEPVSTLKHLANIIIVPEVILKDQKALFSTC